MLCDVVTYSVFISYHYYNIMLIHHVKLGYHPLRSFFIIPSKFTKTYIRPSNQFVSVNNCSTATTTKNFTCSSEGFSPAENTSVQTQVTHRIVFFSLKRLHVKKLSQNLENPMWMYNEPRNQESNLKKKNLSRYTVCAGWLSLIGMNGQHLETWFELFKVHWFVFLKRYNLC